MTGEENQSVGAASRQNIEFHERRGEQCGPLRQRPFIDERLVSQREAVGEGDVESLVDEVHPEIKP